MKKEIIEQIREFIKEKNPDNISLVEELFKMRREEFQKEQDETTEYYNNNAQSFYDGTINANLSYIYEKFLKKLPSNAHILDAGCGVGRDTKYFLREGYEVTAFDASKKMIELASKETGIDVMRFKFEDLNFEQVFDGIWARSSLIHVPYEDTRTVYEKIYKALKPNGIFYASYKYGSNYMSVSNRDFYNMNEDKIKIYLENLFDVIEVWQAKDNSRFAHNKEITWLNFIVRKK